MKRALLLLPDEYGQEEERAEHAPPEEQGPRVGDDESREEAGGAPDEILRGHNDHADAFDGVALHQKWMAILRVGV